MTPFTRQIGRFARPKWILWLGLVGIIAAVPIRAQVVLENSAELNRVDIVERIGATIPLDLTFTDDHGDTVRLSRYFAAQRPVVLILGYYNCPMLCNLVFNGMVDGVNLLDWNPGEEFQILTVSINPEETPDLAASKKANYLKTITRPVSDSSWAFLVGDSSQSRALADAIGFKYFYDAGVGEWAHPAAAFILTPEGRLSRVLYGIQFSKTDLKLSLLEASDGRIGSPMDRLILYCYHYDPDSRGYTLAATNLMKLGGGATMAALGLFLGLLWYGEKQRRRHSDRNADSAGNQAARG